MRRTRGRSALLATLFAAVLACALAGCSNVTDVVTGGAGDGDDAGGTGSAVAATSDVIDIPEYADFDYEAFNARVDDLVAATAGDDTQAVLDLYDELYDSYVQMRDNSDVLYLLYSVNVSSTVVSNKLTWDTNESTEAIDALLTAIAGVCASDVHADAFREHVGDDAFDAFAGYEPATQEELDLLAREQELIVDYYDVLEGADEEDYYGEGINEEAGQIYCELLQVRTQIASAAGYDSYANYADEQLYGRTFTDEEREALYAAVKAVGARYYNLLYYSTATDFAYSGEDVDADELFDTLAAYGEKIDPLVGESAQFLIANDLADMGDDDSRMGGAYTTCILGSHAPFIFQTLDGYSDFLTLTHEFGHFIDFHVNEPANALSNGSGSLDLSEIHSNGLQALYTHYYGDIYGSYQGRSAEAYCVVDLLSNVVDGCIFDEFQREAYANPAMTVEELNQLYQDICEEYGDEHAAEYRTWWVEVPHTFESPMYYFSYAVSGFAALQIWDQAQTDFDGAVATWRAVIDAGAYDHSYFEVIDDAGLVRFSDEAAAEQVLDDAVTHLEDEAEWPQY